MLFISIPQSTYHL